MQSTNVKTSGQTGDDRKLHQRYGEIGIPAVAAAVRYQSDAKNTRYAPVIPRRSERDADAAA